jgi:hypothetical protein
VQPQHGLGDRVAVPAADLGPGPDRAAVVRRLAALEGEGRLGSEQVRLLP